MRSLSDAELLRVWEAGGAEPSGRRALLLLGAAAAAADPATLQVDQRDRLLLELRALLFGPTLECLAGCPACGDRLTFSVPVSELINKPERHASSEISFSHEGFELRARFPTCADLAAVLPDGTTHDLARRCLTSLRCDGVDVDGDAAPVGLLDALDAEFAAVNSGPVGGLALACPGCGHAWEQVLDAMGFVWEEIEAHAVRLLREVHRLASAYHWSESEILRLGPQRRVHYLELVAV